MHASAPITVCITRRVKPGSEAAFERALHEFVQRSLVLPGQMGVHIMRPAPGSGSREYGIVRKFSNRDALDAFRTSPEYLRWNHTALDLTDGDAREKDDPDELLRLACSGEDKRLLEYLVELGANPNAVPENGETALRSALWAVEWRMDFDRHEPYRHRYKAAMEKLKRLIELGARLNPADTDELSFLRRLLVKLDWAESYDFIKFLQEHSFADRAIKVGLLKEPKIRTHLEKRLQALSRMFPELKKWAERHASAGPNRC